MCMYSVGGIEHSLANTTPHIACVLFWSTNNSEIFSLCSFPRSVSYFFIINLFSHVSRVQIRLDNKENGIMHGEMVNFSPTSMMRVARREAEEVHPMDINISPIFGCKILWLKQSNSLGKII